MTHDDWDAHLQRISRDTAAQYRREAGERSSDDDCDRLVLELFDRMASDAPFARAVYAVVAGLCFQDLPYCERVGEQVAQSLTRHTLRQIRQERALLATLPTTGKVH